jgi:hypothetical protein
MPKTPDRFAGQRDEESILFEEASAAPTQEGELCYYNGRLHAKDAIGSWNLRHVIVTDNDTSPAALAEKLVGVDGVSVVVVDPGGNETVRISGAGTAIPPDCCGQILFAVDDQQFLPVTPLASRTGGWMTNDRGYLVVKG